MGGGKRMRGGDERKEDERDEREGCEGGMRGRDERKEDEREG